MDRSSEPATILTGEYPLSPAEWSPEPGRIIFQETTTLGNPRLYDAGSDGARTMLSPVDSNEHSAALSHDRKWLAYVSNRTGRDEVYVRPYPTGGEILVSSDGGVAPVWTPNDSAVMYLDLAAPYRLMLATVEREPEFKFGTPAPHPLAASGYWNRLTETHYDVHADGRLLMLKYLDGSVGTAHINVILHWFEELKERVPTGGR